MQDPELVGPPQFSPRITQRSADSSLRAGWGMAHAPLLLESIFSRTRSHGYFLPDRGVVRAITRAARRGVRVQLLLAGKSALTIF